MVSAFVDAEPALHQISFSATSRVIPAQDDLVEGDRKYASSRSAHEGPIRGCWHRRSTCRVASPSCLAACVCVSRRSSGKRSSKAQWPRPLRSIGSVRAPGRTSSYVCCLAGACIQRHRHAPSTADGPPARGPPPPRRYRQSPSRPLGDQKVDFFSREKEASEYIGTTIAAARDGKPAAEVVPLRGA